MAKRRLRRIEGFDYLGCYRYFVTCCAFDRYEAFTDATIVSPVREQIVRDVRGMRV